MLPFEGRSYDVITACEVIEHLGYGVYERALAEMERVARNAIIITVPFGWKRDFVRCPYCGCSFHPSFHMRDFDARQLRAVFKGFEL